MCSPTGTEAISGADLTAEQEQDIEDDFLGVFETFLLVFAGVALLVAMFSINNAFSILVAQRSRESALLRAIGASRGQVLLAVTVEALVIGVLASLAGLAFGVGLAAGLRALLDAVGFTLPTGALAIDGADMAIAAVVGVVVTFAASVFPALRSTAGAADRGDARRGRRPQQPLAQPCGRRAAGSRRSAWSPRSRGRSSESLGVAGVGAVGLLVGDGAARPGRRDAGQRNAGLAAGQGAGAWSASLAVRNAKRNPRRTAGTASALMVGVAVVTLFTVFAASLKASIDDATSRSFRGDLVIADDSFSGSGHGARAGHVDRGSARGERREWSRQRCRRRRREDA